MPLHVVDHPALPECLGTQWSVLDEDELADLVALVLIGQARHVANILHGAQKQKSKISRALKLQLHRQLHPTSVPAKYHRDGLMFEIITWIIASINTTAFEVVSDPHLTSTQQGIDTIKISLDATDMRLERATIYEQKCTEHPRQEFHGKVMPSFKKWIEGDFDNKLNQLVLGLLDRFHLTVDQQRALYDRLLSVRPLAFRASITVEPQEFNETKCLALFKDYCGLSVSVEDRHGDTFPLADIRAWFEQFSAKVWLRIDALDV